jgi:RNA polymerase subunit RPABC4/transcription elongation factor Spt4
MCTPIFVSMADDPAPIFILACISCGKTVSGKEKSCPQCGTVFEDMCFECPFCGQIVSPGETRCKECGTEFSVFAEEVCESAHIELDGPDASEKPAESSEYECPACGKPVGENDSQCPHCGAKFVG